MEVTEYQKGLMRHTMSDGGRNWFATDNGCRDAIEFNKLVDAGFATVGEAPSWSGDDVVYRLTQHGCDLISGD